MPDADVTPHRAWVLFTGYPLHERFQTQNGVILLCKEGHEGFAIFADRLVGNHIGEVLDAVEFLGGLIQASADIVLQFLGHPYDTLDTAFGGNELLGSDEMSAVTHIAGGLDTATGAGSQLTEAHAYGSHALVLAVDNDDAVGNGLNAADTLEAATGGHGIFQNGIEGNGFYCTMSSFLDHLVNRLITTGSFVDAAFFKDGLAGTLRIELVGSLGIQPRNGAALDLKEKEKKSVNIDDLVLSEKGDLFDDIAASEDYDRLLSVLRDLPDLYREVLMLRYVQELSVKEIAQLLGRNEWAIRKQLARGKTLVQKITKGVHHYEIFDPVSGNSSCLCRSPICRCSGRRPDRNPTFPGILQ